MMLTARLFSAGEALAMGFLNEVVDTAESLDSRVDELAMQVAKLAPVTLRTTKEQLRRMRSSMIANLNDDDLISACYGSRDFSEGVGAFVARRPPEWSGK